MSKSFLMETQDFLFMRLSDAGEYAETIICRDCKYAFSDEIQYLGDGRYLGFCYICDNYEPFTNADVYEYKRSSRHYWMVRQLVKYNHDNGIDMIMASVHNEWQTDGHHRIAVALELGINMILVDERFTPTYDTPADWSRGSPAFDCGSYSLDANYA